LKRCRAFSNFGGDYIIDNSGKRISINYLATTLAVDDRTIQKILKELKEESPIKVIPNLTLI